MGNFKHIIEMKHNRYLLGIALLVAGVLPVFSQVSNDNEDEVNKIEARAGLYDFVPGQVLVKFKEESPMKVRRGQGVFRSSGSSKVDAVLNEFRVETMDKLLPNEQPKPKSLRRRTKSFNGQDIEESDLSQLYILNTNSQSMDSTLMLVEKLKELREVEFVEPNYKVYMMGMGSCTMPATQVVKPVRRIAYSTEVTDDVICSNPEQNPLYSQQWGIPFMKIDELWSKPIVNKKRPVIAILDTGVDITHPDLVDNIWTNLSEAEGELNYDNDGNGFKGDIHGWDFINNTGDIRDYNSHGTHVAGIAAAANNGIGIIGANPQALIMPITVMQSDGTGDVATIAKGVSYAINNGATIINMSLGSYNNSKVLRDVLAKAYQSAVLVAAAGNDLKSIYNECSHTSFSAHNDMVMYPAGYEFVIGVQATSKTGDLTGFSNYDCDGPTYSLPAKDIFSSSEGYVNYEMCAPGDGILGPIPGGNYKKYSGTSMSAPLLSGSISALQMIKEYDSQEILWGDLIHSSNMLDAYNVKNRPAMLELLSIVWDDTKDGGNGDGKPDAGETLSMYPIIKTTWGEASNIKLNLSVAEFDDAGLVDILTTDVDFGWNLSNYAHNTSKNPIKIKISNNVADSRHIRLLLTTTCADAAQDISYEFPIVVNNIVKIGGYLTDDLTLTPDKNYLVDKNIFIPEGVRFVIEPGTILKFNDCGIKNEGEMSIKGTPQKPIVLTTANGVKSWTFITGNYNKLDAIEYCYIENARGRNGSLGDINCTNCVFYHPIGGATSAGFLPYNKMYRCNIIDGEQLDLSDCNYNAQNTNYGECNYINNRISSLPLYEKMGNVNYFNNRRVNTHGTILDQFSFDEWFSSGLVKPEIPSYLGSSREDIINTFILDIDYDYGYAQADLSTILDKPISGAHGVVWKVLVDGIDSQDEYEDLAPLGVGKHKFEVYFNRPMNKEVAPIISFGVREPYTQQPVNEEGSWNEEGTVYTAYKTISGRTMSDGVNRIYVWGAEDDEFFECPYENTRFNINIQSAGSLATGFMGEAGLGKVTLTWNNENNDIEDAMGYNVYRYVVDADGKTDATCINKEIVDIEDTEYIDYDVVPGTTYYYYYKVLSTDLKEYDISNVVSVTPQTASLGDANGSGDVDVADVITTVNFAAGMEPKPFIFEAADMNIDAMIDILDVIGIIQKIMNPAAGAPLMAEAVATYTIEDGVLYVESPVDLAGVQVQLSLSEESREKNEEFTVASDLKGFEHVSAWLSDKDYLFMAYNMSGKTLSAGKHALLNIGDAQIASIRLSNAMGGNVPAVEGETTNIEQVLTGAANTAGIYNLHGQRLAVSADQLSALPKGVYIVDGKKVIKWK